VNKSSSLWVVAPVSGTLYLSVAIESLLSSREYLASAHGTRNGARLMERFDRKIQSFPLSTKDTFLHYLRKSVQRKESIRRIRASQGFLPTDGGFF
jgi:hypothetical protein